MANYAQLKAAIDQVIKANGQQEITGPVLNQVLKAMVDSLGAGYILAGVATPSTNPGTPDQDVYWLAYQGGTYTNFGGAQLPTGISMLKWNGAWSAQTFFTVDDQLTPNSNNLAKSGAAFDAVMQSGVFDLSAYNSGAKYADLSAALTALNRLPAAYKRGGMSIKFVLSSDNKYVQYRFMLSEFTAAQFTNTANWQGIDDEPTAGSNNLVKSGGVFNNINYNKNTIYLTSDWTCPNTAVATYTGTDGKNGVITILNASTANSIRPYMSLADIPLSSVVYIKFKVTLSSSSTFTLGRGEQSGGNWVDLTDIDGNVVSAQSGGYIEAYIRRSDNRAYIKINPSQYAVNETITIEEFFIGVRTPVKESVENLDTYPQIGSYKIPDSNGVAQAIDDAETRAVKGSSYLSFTSTSNTVANYYYSKGFYAIVPGHTYRIYLKSTSWSLPSGITSAHTILAIYLTIDGISTAIVTKNYGDTLSSYYDIVVPSDATDVNYITIRGRAASGVEVGFEIQDVTELLANVSEINTHLSKLDDKTVYKSSFNLRHWPDETGDYTVRSKQINSHNQYINNKYFRAAFIPITPGTDYRIDTVEGGTYAILKSADSEYIEFSASYPSRINIDANTRVKFTAPEDGNVLYIPLVNNLGNHGGTERWYQFEVYEITSIEDAINNIASEEDDSIDYPTLRLADAIGNTLRPFQFTTDENSVILPSNLQEQILVKKSKQMSSIQWTTKKAMPCNNLDSYSGTGKFPAGTTITGLPYSSVKEKDKFVGFNVSIHSFMTAVNNPFSLLYTEQVRGTRSESAWGFVYTGTNCNTYMGVVCSAFACWSNGLQHWQTGHDKYLYQYRHTLSKNFDQSCQGMKIGDIFWESGHNILIAGLKADNNGNITSVLWAQASGNNVTAGWKTPAWVEAYIKNHNGIMYRNIEQYRNLEYMPIPFILIDDETLHNVGDLVFIEDSSGITFYKCTTANSDASFDSAKWSEIPEFVGGTAYGSGSYVTRTVNSIKKLYKNTVESGVTDASWTASHWEEVNCLPWDSYPFTYNNDICTFGGDRATFREGDLVVINYNLDENTSYSWTAIEVYKDGDLLNTYNLSDIDQSELPEGQRGHALKLGTGLTYGQYKARMKNGSTYSNYTYWEVLQTDVAYVENYDGSKSKISWSSNNGTAVFIDVCMSTGSHVVEYEPTEEDVAKGFTVIDLNAMRMQISGSLLSGELYLKVTFRGLYGAVTNELLSLSQGYSSEEEED